MEATPLASSLLIRGIGVDALLDAAPDAMVIVDVSGDILLVNRQAERLFGYARAELLGHPVDVLVPLRFRGHHPEHRGHYFKDLRVRPMGGAGVDLCGLRKDGSEFPAEISLSPLETASGVLVTAAIRDISERKRVEAKFRGLLEGAPDAMVIVGQEGRIQLVNAQAERVFGYERADLLGKPVEMLVPMRYRDQHHRHRGGYFKDPLSRPMGSDLELLGLRKDGSEFPVEISLSPMETDAGMLVTAAIRDVTDRKRTEQQIKSLKEKEVLLKEIHHRVKNNLQVISSLLNLQAEHVTDPKSLAAFRESQNRVRSIALFHERLYRSKDLGRVDMADYLQSLVSNLVVTYDVDPARVRTELELVSIEMGVDLAIPVALIVNELVSNAFKHAFPEPRCGTIRVGLARLGDGLVVRVWDDGVGLPDGFDPLRASSMGLQLVLTLTEQVNGKLDFSSQAGTVVSLTFPYPG